MRRTAGLAALAVIAVAGLAPATALSPSRAAASADPSTGAPGGANAALRGGAKLWAASYRDHTQQNYGQTVVASPDGSTVYVTGTSGLGHVTTVAYNAATGARRWVARYYGLGVSGPLSMAISPDGARLFIGGYTEPPGAALPNRFAIVAYDASTGTLLWASHPFDRPGLATSVAVSPDGSTVFATGVIGNLSDTGGYVTTFAYDAATGTRRWLASYRGTTPSADAQSVAVSPDGREVFVTSPVTSSSGSQSLVTLAYDAATGAARWTRLASGTVDAPERISGNRAIAVSPDSSAVFVTGMFPGASGTSAAITIGYAAATGAPLWSRQYRGPEGNTAGNAVAVSPDGSRVFVTGHSNGITSPYAQNFATVAYATASGRQLWARTFSAPSTFNIVLIGAVAIGVSPDGTRVYVTGTTPGFRSNSENFTTIAYHTTNGATSWAARYRGRRDYGGANSLSVSPAGQAVFVTGFLGAHDGCCNFGTVAYAP
jgi:hypothetical protein